MLYLLSKWHFQHCRLLENSKIIVKAAPVRCLVAGIFVLYPACSEPLNFFSPLNIFMASSLWYWWWALSSDRASLIYFYLELLVLRHSGCFLLQSWLVSVKTSSKKRFLSFPTFGSAVELAVEISRTETAIDDSKPNKLSRTIHFAMSSSQLHLYSALG